MRSLNAVAIALSFIGLSSFAQDDSSICTKDDIYVPISFELLDSDAQFGWVYRSLRPQLKVGSLEFRAKRAEVQDGKLNLGFCIPKLNPAPRFVLSTGPRTYDLASREVLNSPTGPSSMSRIYIAKQTRPDWVVIKSFDRFESKGTALPIFDLELFNFGKEHPGGEVKATFSEYGYACFAGSPRVKVDVEADIVGKRLALSSADPEFPEDLVTRSAVLSTDECPSNFTLQAALGRTGTLSPGVTRIRYGIIVAKGTPAGPETSLLLIAPSPASSPSTKVDVIRYFFSARSVSASVEGDGIWPK